MTPNPRASRQPLVTSWVAQMVGTLVLAGVVMVFVRSMGAPFATESVEWKRYAMVGTDPSTPYGASVMKALEVGGRQAYAVFSGPTVATHGLSSPQAVRRWLAAALPTETEPIA